MGRGIGETSQLPEIKYELQTADPFSLYGLTGVGFGVRLSPPVIPAKAGIQT